MIPVLVLDHCRACGRDADVVRVDGELRCGLCGAPQTLLGGREIPPPGPRFDLGQSQQVCPVCSTVDHDVLGIFTRASGRFDCGQCGAMLSLERYENALDEFRRLRWLAFIERRQIRDLLKRRAG